ncbi:MAG: hypothetical protein HFI92_08470, partial [Lachnospiraceae bacterium]|nr:hypothetical protein [Lachnospiraceae bacterium]
MRGKRKIHRLSCVLVWMTVISFLPLLCPMGRVMASQPETAEPGAKQVAEGDIFQVIFPSDTDHVFDFIMDPQKLISQTDAAAYGGSVFEEDATLFFRRRDGEVPEDYSSSSDALVITNAGTAEADLTVTAEISMDSMEGIALTEDREFVDDTGASLYLALTDGKDTVPIGEEGATIHTGLKGEYRFWLTGAVNENGDWSSVEGAVPKVTVTWNVASHEEEKPEEDRGTDESNAPAEDPASSAGGNETEQALPAANETVTNAAPSEGGSTAGQPDASVEGKKEPFGEKGNLEGPETSGEGEQINTETQEPSKEEETPKGPEPSGEDEGRKEPQPSGENVSSEASTPPGDG